MLPNPVAHRLTRQHRWPSLRLTFWLGFALGLLSLTISMWALLHLRENLLNFLLLGAWGVMLISPMLIAPMAAFMTGRDLKGDKYELLYITSLSDEKLVQGYILAALYRLRGLIVAGVGLMPALVISMVYVGLRYEAVFATQNGFYRSFQEETAVPNPAEITWLALVFMAVSFFIVSLNFPAAGLGVALALRWKSSVLSGVMASISIAMMLVLVVGGFNLLLFLSFGNPFLLTFCQSIFLFICLYGMWVPMLSAAFRFARSPLY